MASAAVGAGGCAGPRAQENVARREASERPDEQASPGSERIEQRDVMTVTPPRVGGKGGILGLRPGCIAGRGVG